MQEMKIELYTESLLIRPFRAEDIDALYEAVRESVTEISLWLAWCHAGYSREESAAFILSRREAGDGEEEYSFAVFDAERNLLLGGVGLNQFNREYKIANLGYWVRTSCAGRGVASAAARRVARFGLGELGLRRVEIVAAVGNGGSRRAAEKARARREGVLRKRLLIRGESRDAVLYSLVAEDL